MKKIAIIFFLLIPSFCFGAVKYMLPSGAGGTTGADWSNACAGFNDASCTPARGDTIVVGGHATEYDLNGFDFDVSESGSTYIYYRKATSDDCSTAGYAGAGEDDCNDDAVAGWASSYETTTAVLTAENSSSSYKVIDIQADYYKIDGITGDAWSTTGHGFHIKITDTTFDMNGVQLISSIGYDYIKIYHSKVEGVTESEYVNSYGPDSGDGQIVLFYGYAGSNYWEIKYCYVTEATSFALMSSGNYWVWEYNYFDKFWGGGGAAAFHGNGFNQRSSVWNVWRYNYFEDIDRSVDSGAGITGWFASTGTVKDYSGVNNTEIYGNIFDGTPYIRLGTASSACSTDMDDWKIYNNTFYNLTLRLAIDERDGSAGCTGFPASGWLIKNNLFYNADLTLVSGDCGTPCVDHQYNWYNQSSSQLSSPAGTGEFSTTQTAGSVFADAPGDDFTPVVGALAIDAGTSLVGYSTDPDGNIRGADGTFDIGAFEYGSGPLNTGNASGNITRSN